MSAHNDQQVRSAQSWIRIMAENYFMAPAQIVGRSRNIKIVEARGKAMLKVRQMTDLTDEEIGRLFHRKPETVAATLQEQQN